MVPEVLLSDRTTVRSYQQTDHGTRGPVIRLNSCQVISTDRPWYPRSCHQTEQLSGHINRQTMVPEVLSSDRTAVRSYQQTDHGTRGPVIRLNSCRVISTDRPWYPRSCHQTEQLSGHINRQTMVPEVLSSD